MMRTRYSISQLILFLSAFCALLCLLLRANGVISFSEARQLVTSGYEEESLYAMWKFLHGQNVYTLPNQIPFAASYFNWLFYEVYGELISLVVRTFQLQEEWIPTIGRCVTLSIVGIGTWLTTKLFMGFGYQKTLSTPLAVSFSILLWGSPLIGFWALTVRPDILGLVFDLLAAFYLLRYLPKNSVLAVILAAVGCYLSWSCKQINIVMPMAIGLYLLWDKKWKLCVLFSALLISLYTVTLMLAAEPMLKMIFFMDTAVPLSLETLTHNLLQFAKKSVAVLFLFAVVIFHARGMLFQSPLFRLGLCGLLVWSMTLLPASSKVGSAENYYFLAPCFMLFIIAAAFIRNTLTSRWESFSLAGAGVIFISTLVISINTGFVAALDNQHAQNKLLKQCLATLQPPIFIMNHYGALPWMNSSPPAFVLAYNYWHDRQAGVPFEANGIGGLIEKSYFNTLVLPVQINDQFDFSALTGYERQNQQCAGYAVYQKRETT